MEIPIGDIDVAHVNKLLAALRKHPEEKLEEISDGILLLALHEELSPNSTAGEKGAKVPALMLFRAMINGVIAEKKSAEISIAG